MGAIWNQINCDDDVTIMTILSFPKRKGCVSLSLIIQFAMGNSHMFQSREKIIKRNLILFLEVTTLNLFIGEIIFMSFVHERKTFYIIFSE